MTLRPLTLAAALAVLAAPAFLAAQEEISASEEQRLEALAKENAEQYVPKNTVSVGFRLLTSGGKVTFGNLGSVPFIADVPAASAGNVDRNYDNGYVQADSPRGSEIDTNGVQTSTPGGIYQTTTTTNVTDTNGNVIGTTTTVNGQYLSYTPGLSRSWSYASPDQLATPGYVSMSTYSASSDGGSMEKKQGASGGIELQFSHTMGHISRRVTWGIATGIALNTINTKVSGDIQATLNTKTDYYSLNGQAAPALPTTTDATTGITTTTSYIGPSYTDLLDGSGNVITTLGQENTVPINQLPDPSMSTSTSAVGAVTVHGLWQLKGAYAMVKLGPSVNIQLTDRFGLNASFGLAGAYVGTRYTATESFDVPDVTNTITTTDGTDQTESNTTKFLSGYYADLNLEFMANETTGLFGGLTAQKLSDYDQVVGGRTAHVDLGNAVGLRAGVSVRF